MKNLKGTIFTGILAVIGWNIGENYTTPLIIRTLGLSSPPPASTPIVKVPVRLYMDLLADNQAAATSVWSTRCDKAEECFAFMAKAEGRPVFQIRDGDGPAGVGGPCDLGKLVRSAEAHLELERMETVFIPGYVSQTRFESRLLRGELARCKPR